MLSNKNHNVKQSLEKRNGPSMIREHSTDRMFTKENSQNLEYQIADMLSDFISSTS